MLVYALTRKIPQSLALVRSKIDKLISESIVFSLIDFPVNLVANIYQLQHLSYSSNYYHYEARLSL
jgi:hypothetical protein